MRGQQSLDVGWLGRTLESFTGESPVRDRLQVTAHTDKRDMSAGEQVAFDDINERLTFMMEADAHLRYIGVGVHNDRSRPTASRRRGRPDSASDCRA